MSELFAAIEADARGILNGFDPGLFTKRTVLVTGATGLIGTYLVAALRDANHHFKAGMTIHAVSRTPPPAFLGGLFSDPWVQHHCVDLADLNTASQHLPSTDLVIHAAGYGQPGKFLQDPVKTILLNVGATSTLLQTMHENGRFLFVSSSEVYSGAAHMPHGEVDIGTTDPAHPRSSYIEGKRCGEALCYAWASRAKHAQIARLALAYGPGTYPDDQRVLYSLIRQAIHHKKIVLLDHGLARRNYLYVTDAIGMLLSILLKGIQPVYNVSGRSAVTILGMAQAIGRLLKVPVHVPTVAAGLAGAPSEVVLDLNRYIDEFGKTDFVSFDEGLIRTITWQQKLYDEFPKFTVSS